MGPTRPKDLSLPEWEQCQEFAFQFAKQQGWFDQLKYYTEISLTTDYGVDTYLQGLNYALVGCRFWRVFYTRNK